MAAFFGSFPYDDEATPKQQEASRQHPWLLEDKNQIEQIDEVAWIVPYVAEEPKKHNMDVSQPVFEVDFQILQAKCFTASVPPAAPGPVPPSLLKS